MSPKRVGRYEIIERLGKGAMAVVYLAHDPVIGRNVALKTLRLDLDSDLSSEFRQRFLREARAAGRLSHPGIVTVHDVGEDTGSGHGFIAMELIEGHNLKELLAGGQPFAPSEAARIVGEIARALDYAHRMGVIHRDIKPANIMITKDGAAKITDFGVARMESSNLTLDGQFIGTPNYMSPEQITGRPLDRRTDIFSAGVVLFELLTGRRPFPGTSIAEVSLRIVEETPAVPSSLRPEIPNGFNPVVLKCLEKAPENRFQTAGELADVLAALSLSQAPPDGTRVSRPRGALVNERAALFATHATPPRPAAAASRGKALDSLKRARDGSVTAIRRTRDGLRARLAAAPLPPIFSREVTTSWAWRVVAAWSALCLAVALVLALRVPGPPPPAPTAARVAHLHQLGAVLHRAAATLRDDPARARDLARAVLDQAPASPAARRIVHAADAALQLRAAASAAKERADALVAEGRRLFRKRRYRSAAARFKQALALEPANDLAANYLELARERARTHAAKSTGKRPAAAAPPAQTGESSPAAKPGIAHLTISFASPINAGMILVTLDGETLLQAPFDFTRRIFLGIKKKGTGQVRKTVLAPSGRHTLGVQLNDRERGPLGFASFTKVFAPGSAWTIRIDLPPGSDNPIFYLVQARSSGA